MIPVNPHLRLTPDDIDFIKESYTKLTANQMAVHLGCSSHLIYCYCRRLKIKPIKSYFQ